MSEKLSQIRDPIHGAMTVSARERRLLESKALQRLRNIKQLGFADFAFPGATHARFSHSLGAMHLAGRIFDQVFSPNYFDADTYQFFRQCVRLAMLLHDVGHPPLSHASEISMPDVSRLRLPQKNGRQATHEDYTQKIILDSALSKDLADNFRSAGITPAMIASLLDPHGQNDTFFWQQKDHTPILRQILSSEMDADRMDYLLRDSFYCGVSYGKFDSAWLIDNLVPIEHEQAIYLGIRRKAIYAFEDFLLSRYHMFNSVYLHHTPMMYQKMLANFLAQSSEEFSLPEDIESYVNIDDIDMWHTLRRSQNLWASRIVQQKPYFLLEEWQNHPGSINPMASNLEGFLQELSVCGIDAIVSRHQNSLSKYFQKQTDPLFVQIAHDRRCRLDEYSLVFARYQNPEELVRIFVSPEHKEMARSMWHIFMKNNVDTYEK